MKNWNKLLILLLVTLFWLPAIYAAPSNTPLRLPGDSVIRQRFSAQLQALAQEKSSRTTADRKIHSQLLYAVKQNRGDTFPTAMPLLKSNLKLSRDGNQVLVDIKTTAVPEITSAISKLGGVVVNGFPEYASIRAFMPLPAIPQLAKLTAVRSISPAERLYTNKINTSQGEIAHATNAVRVNTGIIGIGAKIGILSDNVGSLTALQASGDLPSTVTVLPGQGGSFGTSEGTAMLEIAYDLAPGAGLYFATAGGGQASFASNIRALRDVGCDVIVDDSNYPLEPVFQDGIIAQAIQQVTGNGALYFSAAGNFGNLTNATSGVWEGNFNGLAGDPFGNGVYQAAHIFSSTNIIGDKVVHASPSYYVLTWSDPLGASGNDYDLFLVDDTFTPQYASTNTQDGDKDPIEVIDVSGIDTTGLYVVILKYSGEDRFLHLASNGGQLQFATTGQISGHAAAENAFSVAAVDIATANGGKFTGSAANPVEAFSSSGPRRMFYAMDGTAYTPGNFLAGGGVVRQKPDIAAADGIATATPGFNPFYGTSAAAAHAAAIAALMHSGNPTINIAAARALFSSTALDIESPGIDSNSGYGIIMADNIINAIGNIVTPTTGIGGSVSPSISQILPTGSTTSFLVTPNKGYNPDTKVGGTCPLGSWNGSVWTTGAITTACFVNFNFTTSFCWACMPNFGGWRAAILNQWPYIKR